MPFLGTTGGGSVKQYGGQANLGYFIKNSLRFRSSASGYLNRTPAGAGSTTKGTFSFWIKRGILSTAQQIYHVAGTSGNNSRFFLAYAATTDTFSIVGYDSAGTVALQLVTTQVFRDPSAWYHIVIAIDTTQPSSSNRAVLYINGVQVSAFGTSTIPAQNTALGFTNNTASLIGANTGATNYFDGYLAEINFVNGQQLNPSSFGKTYAATGQWIPKKFTGAYGTNGFYLKFADASAATAAAIGKDSSPNGNNWTPNNISVTSGATYDAMIDSPTLTSATAANYSVANPLSTLYTVTAGNLDFTYTNSTSGVWYLKGTLAVSSDKYYWEVIPSNVGAGSNISIGIILSTNTQTNTTTINLVTDGYVYHCDGNKYSGSTSAAYGATYTNNDVIGVALDLTAGTLVFYKNNVSQGTAYTGLTSSYMLLVCNHLGGASRTVAGSVNFGQRPFVYTAPANHVALNTFNL